MRRMIASDDVARLVRAAERMARMAQEIGERTQGGSADTIGMPSALVGARAACPTAERLVQAARSATAAHRRQPDFGLPGLFRNPVWLLMLELFVAGRSGGQVSIKTASLILGGAITTANRTILDLERHGLIASVSDAQDARRRLLVLTPSADDVLRSYLTQQIEYSEPSLRLSLKIAQGETPSSSNMAPQSDRSESSIETILQ